MQCAGRHSTAPQAAPPPPNPAPPPPPPPPPQLARLLQQGHRRHVVRHFHRLCRGHGAADCRPGGWAPRLGRLRTESGDGDTSVALLLPFPASSHASSSPPVPPACLQVVVEFTYNEPEDDPFDSPTRRGFEELLRKLLKLENG